jgi:hypothetical protein
VTEATGGAQLRFFAESAMACGLFGGRVFISKPADQSGLGARIPSRGGGRPGETSCASADPRSPEASKDGRWGRLGLTA